jgi:HAD superfamily hydrolase (TIGR01509 family)
VSAVFFDFAGTLFSDRALRDAHLRQLRFVADAVGVKPSDTELRTAYKAGMRTSHRRIAGATSYQHRDLFGGAFAGMAEALGGTLDVATVQEAVDRQYLATIENAELRPGCVDTLKELRNKGFHVSIVSNIDEEQLRGLLDRFGLKPFLDAWTSSEEAGSCKPDPGIYRLALKKSGSEPGDVLFVGDSLHHDIEGPAAIGIHTAWLTSDGKPGTSDIKPDFVIDRLEQVLDCLNFTA